MFSVGSSSCLRIAGRLVAAVGLTSAASASAQQADRSVVPIREVVIRPGGTPRYAVTLRINGAPVEVGLDTGSVGLRVLPGASRRVGIQPGPQVVIYSYDSGVQLDGHRAVADLQIGAARGKVALQAVERVSCVNGGDCPAATLPSAAYGLMGSGQPGQGFQAIMGTRLNQGNVPNPLSALGVRRWIVHLPQRGGSGGALILNPDASDLVGFVPLRNGAGTPGTVGGCVMVERPGARRICGPTLLDTGAPGLAVRGAQRPPGWQPGVPARLALVGASGQAAAVAFRAGDAARGATARFVPGRGDGVSLSAGTLPFYAYDVLYDRDRGGMAVRPNATAGGAVRPVRQ
jgi:hypothetical protein